MLTHPPKLSWPAEFTLGPRASADPGAGHPGDEGLREWQCALTVIYRLLTRSPHSHLPAKHSTINPQSHLPNEGRSERGTRSGWGESRSSAATFSQRPSLSSPPSPHGPPLRRTSSPTSTTTAPS